MKNYETIFIWMVFISCKNSVKSQTEQFYAVEFDPYFGQIIKDFYVQTFTFFYAAGKLIFFLNLRLFCTIQDIQLLSKKLSVALFPRVGLLSKKHFVTSPILSLICQQSIWVNMFFPKLKEME